MRDNSTAVQAHPPTRLNRRFSPCSMQSTASSLKKPFDPKNESHLRTPSPTTPAIPQPMSTPWLNLRIRLAKSLGISQQKHPRCNPRSEEFRRGAHGKGGVRDSAGLEPWRWRLISRRSPFWLAGTGERPIRCCRAERRCRWPPPAPRRITNPAERARSIGPT